MPSLSHEGLVLLFRNAPTLAADLLRDILHKPVPAFEHARIGEADVTQLLPATFTSDLVVLLEHGPDRKTACAIIVEAQLRTDADKRRSWPVYVCGLRAKLDCDAVLLVVAVDEAVAKWAAKPIPIGHPGFALTPLVLGPDEVPVIAEPEKAVPHPELAVLSVIVHGPKQDTERALAMATSALVACHGLEDDRALYYSELVFQSLNDAAKAALEKIMANGQFEFQSEFAKKHRSAGRQEGRQEGEARGRAEGEAQAIVTFLEARGVPVSDEVRSRILACTELDTLNRWVRKAATVTSVDELFAD